MRYAFVLLLAIVPLCLAQVIHEVGEEQGFSQEQLKIYHALEATAVRDMAANKPWKIYLSTDAVKKDKPDMVKRLQRVRTAAEQVWFSFDNDDAKNFVWLSARNVVAFQTEGGSRTAHSPEGQREQQLQLEELQKINMQVFYFGVGSKDTLVQHDVYLSTEDLAAHTPTLTNVAIGLPARIADVWYLRFGTNDSFEPSWFVPASSVVAITWHEPPTTAPAK